MLVLVKNMITLVCTSTHTPGPALRSPPSAAPACARAVTVPPQPPLHHAAAAANSPLQAAPLSVRLDVNKNTCLRSPSFKTISAMFFKMPAHLAAAATGLLLQAAPLPVLADLHKHTCLHSNSPSPPWFLKSSPPRCSSNRFATAGCSTFY